MSEQFEVAAQVREAAGTGESRRLRRQGKVPGVLYGAGQPNVHITMDHDEMRHKLAVEAFHTAVIAVKTGRKTDKAILRAVQMHPCKLRIVHIDFQRIKETEKLHLKVPLHVSGDDVAPGIKTQGGILGQLINEIDISCLPRDLPEYLEVDVSGLEINQSLHLSDVKLPEGVEISSMAHGGEDLAVVAVNAPRVEVEEEPKPEETEGEEGEEQKEERETSAED